MRITLTSVLVDDQEKALRFSTDVLGFVKKTDVPVGEARWLTVVVPDQPDGPELVLEPDGHPAVRPFKETLVEDGIPFTSFAFDDVHAESERLRRLGVRFTQEPLEMGSSRPPSSTTRAETSSRSQARREPGTGLERSR